MSIQYFKKPWSSQSKKWFLCTFLAVSITLISCQKKDQKLACGPKPCPDYFINFVEATDTVVEAQENYVNRRKQFRLKHTYNQPALDELLRCEEKLNVCLEATPLGNKKERTEFFRKWNTSSLREVHETDRYFQDKLADHYLHNANCFKEAEIKLQRLIDKQ